MRRKTKPYLEDFPVICWECGALIESPKYNKITEHSTNWYCDSCWKKILSTDGFSKCQN